MQPLVGVEGTRMRVGDSWIYPEEGVPYVFDDSFEHEVWHDGPATRIVLIFDIWHPELSTEEVSLLTTLRNSKLRFEKLQSQHDSSGDNFFSIIERSRRLLNANSDWWVAAPEDEEREDPSTATDLIITGRNCAIGAGGGSSSSACVSLPALRAGSRERDPLVSGRDRLGASAVPRVGASSGWDFRVSPSASAPVAASASSASGLAATVGGQGERQVPTGAIGFEGGGNVEDPSSASGPSPNCDNYFVLNASGSSTLSDNASVGPN
uniref:Aspartyl/asparaginy/proline hydroxylase domain-containing protein n=1 Tax=Chromera velia CCMP2878 TaxID=1169474 RepID=A0A0G4HPH1_9ALVE|eukprot:Cvel_29816.t1-p1 / transcript=Cvel_29816.t1 / gene=Cvel_29816 / organism=Chromera_velia_CCMP2878 / gene_product=Aspartyl/asparaginyl beta-hydroxylase, putative / transcript_product=Aspartyl/asparaginyl beta-hydroxylase, putative / location=Cvel_scaffold4152:1145-3697(+) / protein_length=265 / sequence_SO=supercontig / SO=protein_coding / is_pseudo=false